MMDNQGSIEPSDTPKVETTLSPSQANLAETSELLSVVKKLQMQFETRLLSDSNKDKMIDRLHQELQGYRNDLIKNQLRPLLIELIQLFDSYHKHVESLKSKNSEDLNISDLLNDLAMVPDDLLDILYRQGVEPFTLDEIEFQPGKQKLVQKKNTPQNEKNRHIASRLKPGFVWGEELLRQEWVDIYVYQEPLVELPAEETNDPPQDHSDKISPHETDLENPTDSNFENKTKEAPSETKNNQGEINQA